MRQRHGEASGEQMDIWGIIQQGLALIMVGLFGALIAAGIIGNRRRFKKGVPAIRHSARKERRRAER